MLKSILAFLTKSFGFKILFAVFTALGLSFMFEIEKSLAYAFVGLCRLLSACFFFQKHTTA